MDQIAAGSDLEFALHVVVPLLAGMLVAGLAIRFGWRCGWLRPIDGGRCWRGRRILGASKTWRGVWMFALGCSLGYALQAALLGDTHSLTVTGLAHYGVAGNAAIGFLVGLGAMLSELPNSFAKRRLGIEPGESGFGLAAAFFRFLDQVDVLAGAWLVLALFVPIRPLAVLWSLVIVFVAHQLLTRAGHALGMRATPR